MYYSFKRLLYVFVFILVSISTIISQDCSANYPNFSIGSLSSTEATCGDNGTISITASGGSGQYEFKVESTCGDNTSYVDDNGAATYTFVGITAPQGGCEYTITARVKGTNCAISSTVMVNSDYINMDIPTYTVNQPMCDGENGSVNVTPINGLAPYTYSATDGTNNYTSNDGNFDSLPEGTYQFSVMDACGNSRVLSDVVIDNIDLGDPTIDNVVQQYNATCMINLNLTTSNGVSPYTYQLCDMNGLNCTQTTTDPDGLSVDASTLQPGSNNYYIKVTDACGNSTTTPYNIDNSIYLYIERNCDAGMDSYDVYVGSSLDFPDFTYTITDGTNSITKTFATQHTNLLATVPEGTYTLSGTNACNTNYLDVIGTLTPQTAGFSPTATDISPSFCTEGSGRFRLDIPYIQEVTALNATYNIISSDNPNITTPYSLTAISVFGAVWLDEVPQGTHTIQIIDSNGCPVDNITVTVIDPNILEHDLTVTTEPGCTSSVITAEATTNLEDSLIEYRLINNGSVISTNTTGIFNNVTDGTYTIQAFIYKTSYPSCEKTLSEDVIIAANSAPDATGTRGLVCDNNTGFISVDAFNGVQPYEYRIKEKDADPSTYSAWQNSNEFSGLTIGQYDVEVRDACLQTQVTTVIIETFSPLQLTRSGYVCLNEPVTFTVDPLSGANYFWELPDGTSMTTTDNSIVVNMTQNKLGSYKVTVTVNNCIERIVDIFVNADPNCDELQPVPVKLIEFKGEKKKNYILLNWVTASELDNNYFEIQRSKDGKAFESIGHVDGKGNSNRIETYRFIDRDNAIGTEYLYYRLKQIDYNSSYEYSKVIQIKTSNTFSIYPNPAFSNESIYITGSKNTSIVFSSLLGAQIKTIVPASDVYRVDISQILPGIYFLTSKDGQINEKIIIQ